MSNLKYYQQLATVPPEAKKPIKAGRLKGMSDINPMWRIKAMTDVFGPCGIGWSYKIIDKKLIDGSDGQICAFVDIELKIKVDGEWSEPIPGTGGSSFIAKESRGLHTSDECFKMALTDALSVSMKALGVAASVYFEKDRTKYSNDGEQTESDQPSNNNTGNGTVSEKKLIELATEKGFTTKQVLDVAKKSYNDPASEIKYIKAENKKKLYDKLMAYPDKGAK